MTHPYMLESQMGRAVKMNELDPYVSGWGSQIRDIE